MLLRGVEGQAVVGLNDISHAQAELLRHITAHHCLLGILMKNSTAGGEGVFPIVRVRHFKKFRSSADDPEVMIIIAHHDRHRALDEAAVGLAGYELVFLPEQRAGRLIHVKHAEEHEAEFRAATAHHRIKPAVHAGKGAHGLLFYRHDGHQQPRRQRDAHGGDAGGQRVLSQALADDEPQRHACTSAAWLISARSNTVSNWSSTAWS